MHLNEWGNSFFFLVLSLGELFLKLALQYQAIFLLYWIWWRLLHFWYLIPYVWQIKVVCLYFQQFFYWEIPGLILVPKIIAMWYPILKHLLIRLLAFIPFFKSQMLTQITVISNLGEALIIWDWEVRTMLLKR